MIRGCESVGNLGGARQLKASPDNVIVDCSHRGEIVIVINTLNRVIFM